MMMVFISTIDQVMLGNCTSTKTSSVLANIHLSSLNSQRCLTLDLPARPGTCLEKYVSRTMTAMIGLNQSNCQNQPLRLANRELP